MSTTTSLRQDVSDAVRPERVKQHATRQIHTWPFLVETGRRLLPGALALSFVQHLPWLITHCAPLAHALGIQGA